MLRTVNFASERSTATTAAGRPFVVHVIFGASGSNDVRGSLSIDSNMVAGISMSW